VLVDPDAKPYQRRAARRRATKRWRQQVAGLTSLQMVDIARRILASVMAADADFAAGKAPPRHRAAEQAMVRAAAFLAEVHARNPTIPKEEPHAD
jgi:hypothetical protein